MYINHNGMAQNVSNTLTSHYSNLATSTERLSSGLRVNSAADDAAGLAIRELMRADIAALNQGVRNANDAISLIQTADGALGIIDEKLIRMKELAEQAATGTYDSTQRLMIESEYQAMASEITRIANATDFNGIKLLNGKLDGTHDGSKMEAEGALKVHFGTANDSAEDYYYIEIEEMTAQALGVGNASTWEDVTNRAVDAFKKQYQDSVKASGLTEAQKGEALAQMDTVAANYKAAIDKAVKPENAHKYWAPDAAADTGFLAEGKKAWEESSTNSTVMNDYMAVAKRDPEAFLKSAAEAAIKELNVGNAALEGITTWPVTAGGADETAVKNYNKALFGSAAGANPEFGKIGAAIDKIAFEAGYSEDDAKAIKTAIAAAADAADPTAATATSLDTYLSNLTTAITGAVTTALGNNVTTTKADAQDNAAARYFDTLRDADQQKLQYAWGQAAVYNLAHLDPADEANAATTPASFGIGVADTSFGLTGADTANSEQNKILKAALNAGYEKVKDMDFAGHSIATQEDAQHALVALDAAITQKDKTRAHLGALQNRLENTVSNLTVQSENLQAAESRISDVDVATEMTNFVRNQILTQSAVAMLSQANSMPQMAMQLIH